jgi:hypothetical protein
MSWYLFSRVLLQNRIARRVGGIQYDQLHTAADRHRVGIAVIAAFVNSVVHFKNLESGLGTLLAFCVNDIKLLQ